MNATTSGPVELLRRDDAGDDPLFTFEAMSLLLGVSAAHIRELWWDPDADYRLPEVWAKSGLRRRKEAEAHTGSNDLLDGFAYWADRDHGAAIEIDAHGTVYMVATEAL